MLAAGMKPDVAVCIWLWSACQAIFLLLCRISAEIGLQEGAKGPGSLRMMMLDALHNMSDSQILEKLRLLEAT